MALPTSSVQCLLCRGQISIRSGNLDKVRLHMEHDHDLFYEHDLLIALNFLEEFEREEIIEKALPRMRVIFDNVKKLDQRSATKRLLDNEECDELSSKKVKIIDARINNNETSSKSFSQYHNTNVPFLINGLDIDQDYTFNDVNEELDDESSDDELEVVVDKIEMETNEENRDCEENDSVNDSESLAVNIQTLKDQILALQDATRNEQEEEINEGMQTNDQSQLIVNENQDLSTHSASKSIPEHVFCDICHKKYAKTSLNKHRKRCLQKQTNETQSNESGASGEPDHTLSFNSTFETHNGNSDSLSTVSPKSKTASCQYCNKTMLKGNLSRHIKQLHGDLVKGKRSMVTNKGNDDDVDSKTSSGEETMAFKCKLCNISVPSEDELRTHSSEVHSLDYEDIEAMLGEESERASMYPDEEIVEAEEDQDSSNHDVTAKMEIKDEDDATVGKESSSSKPKHFKCFFCDAEFSWEKTRKRHVRQCHSNMLDEYASIVSAVNQK